MRIGIQATQESMGRQKIMSDVLAHLTESEIIRVAMRLLGQKTSRKKARSSRRNGKLGGRKPKKSRNVPTLENIAK